MCKKSSNKKKLNIYLNELWKVGNIWKKQK